MHRFRIIPSLLMEDDGLVKGTHFKHHRYIGDPLNAVSIFNEKEVDEVVILDRSALKNGINFSLIERIATQAFIPLSYGGGIKTVEDAGHLMQSGVEKVILNTTALTDPDVVSAIASRFGSSSTIVAIDAKASLLGEPKVWAEHAKHKTNTKVLDHAKKMEAAGAGEILLTSVDHEGTLKGFDLKLIHNVANALTIPLIASGGGGNMKHIQEAVTHGASAVAIGSMCVFWGKHKAVLINYPGQNTINEQMEVAI